MRWLDRLVARMVDRGRDYEEVSRKYPDHGARLTSTRKSSSVYADQGEGSEFKNPMNITLYNAVGGRIVRFTRWDQANDCTQETTYVVGTDEDFEKALAKFIALEALKHVS